MVFEVVDERLVSGENAVVIDIVPITVWILKGIGAVERVDTEAGRIPGAQALGLPAVGEGIAVGIDEVRVCDGPRFDRLRGFAVIFEQIPVQPHHANNRPLVFAQVWQTVAVGIPIGIVGSQRVKAPIVSTGEGIANPSAMLNFPAIGHAVAIRVRVGRVGRCVDVGQREVRGVGSLAFVAVADVLHLYRVIAPKRALFVEEAVVFGTVAHAVAVGVADARIGGVVPFRREFDVTIFVKVGPQPLEVHVAGLVQIKAVGIVVKERIPRVGRVQTVDDFPPVGHAVGVRIVGPGVHQLQVGIAAGRGRTVHRSVPITG